MQEHLNRKHPQSTLSKNGPTESNKKATQSLIVRHVLAKPNAGLCFESRKNAINELLLDFIVTDLRPLNVVAGEGFQRLIRFLELS